MTYRPSRGALMAKRSTQLWTVLLATINVAIAGSISLVLAAILR